MRSRVDLTSYVDVKAQAREIQKHLKGEKALMPPINDGGPWPEEWIALFDRWIEERMPE